MENLIKTKNNCRIISSIRVDLQQRFSTQCIFTCNPVCMLKAIFTTIGTFLHIDPKPSCSKRIDSTDNWIILSLVQFGSTIQNKRKMDLNTSENRDDSVIHDLYHVTSCFHISFNVKNCFCLIKSPKPNQNWVTDLQEQLLIKTFKVTFYHVLY